MSALTKIQKIFPQVKTVKDSKKSIAINVTKADSKAGRKKDFAHCALAKACVRTKIAEGAIIGLTTSYLINGTTATRYKTSVAVSREITSFDRHQDFAAGKAYKLMSVPPTMTFEKHNRRYKSSGRNGKQKKIIHRTAFVRKLKSL